MQGNLMATAVCLSAGAWRLLMDQVDLMDLMDKMGAPRDNPRVCSAAVGFGSECRFTAGVMQLADLPQGKTSKKNPAARLKESAAVPTGKSVRDF